MGAVYPGDVALAELLDALQLEVPFGLSSSAVRCSSVTIGTPPAWSMFIISEVPDRGSPETTITGADWEVEADIAAITWGDLGVREGS